MVLEPTFSTLYDRWESISSEGRWNEALAACEDLFAASRKSQRPVLFLKAKMARGISAFWCGHFLKALNDLQEASMAPEPSVRFKDKNPQTSSICQAYLSLLKAIALHSREALDLHHSSIDLARSSECPLVIAQVMAAESFFHRLRREVSPTLRHANLLKDHCREYGLTFWYSQAGVLSGWAKVMAGEVADGIREMEKHLAELSSGHFDNLALVSLAEGFLLAGDPDNALTVLERSIARSGEGGDRVLLPETWRLLAETLSLRGRPEGEVLQAYERSLSIAGEQVAPLFEVQATLSLDHWEKSQGRSNPLTRTSLLHLEESCRDGLPDPLKEAISQALSVPGSWEKG